MKRRWVRAIILVFWACMAGWLIRFKAFPEYFGHTLSGYGGFLSKDVLIADSWMRVLFNGTPIGYSHTVTDVDDEDFSARFSVRNLLHVQLNLMGSQQKVVMDSSAVLNGLYDLQFFSLRMNAGSYRMALDGRRAGKTTFDVDVVTPNSREKRQVEIPADTILYSPMMEVTMKRLKPGQEIAVRILDPATLKPKHLTIKALRREVIAVRGKEQEALVLSSEYGGATVLTWLGRDGDALRQETPYGWTLERCTPDEAFDAVRSARGGPDVLAGMAVKIEGRIRDPRRCAWLRLKLKGVEFAANELATPRQDVLRIDGKTAELRISRQRETVPQPGAESPERLAALQQPSAALQSDHPEVLALARRITADRATPLEKAYAIHDWLYEKIEKTMTVSLPSALDVLRSGKGDCNEHAYLAVALARAAGLPAEIMVGVAYQDGRFYYHAWPAVFVGHWLEMDPTWGQREVDATHIALLQGELSEQLKLLKILGQLGVEVLEEQAPAGDANEKPGAPAQAKESSG